MQGQAQKAAWYPFETTPCISDSLVVMSPQQEHLELLLFPLLSVDDIKNKLRIDLSLTDSVHQELQAFIRLVMLLDPLSFVETFHLIKHSSTYDAIFRPRHKEKKHSQYILAEQQKLDGLTFQLFQHIVHFEQSVQDHP